MKIRFEIFRYSYTCGPSDDCNVVNFYKIILKFKPKNGIFVWYLFEFNSSGEINFLRNNTFDTNLCYI